MWRMFTAKMDQMTEHKLQRQLFLIRYTSLLSILKTKGNLNDQQLKELQEAIVNVSWIDNELNKIQTKPSC